MFEWKTFHIKVDVEVLSTNCTDYETPRAYFDCLGEKEFANMIKELGCLPAWMMFQKRNDSFGQDSAFLKLKECNSTIENTSKELQKIFNDTMAASLNFRPFDDGKTCMEPCTLPTFTSTLTTKRANRELLHLNYIGNEIVTNLLNKPLP